MNRLIQLLTLHGTAKKKDGVIDVMTVGHFKVLLIVQKNVILKIVRTLNIQTCIIVKKDITGDQLAILNLIQKKIIKKKNNV